MDSGYRILFVDDDPALGRAFRRTFTDEGCSIDFASQADAALDLLAHEPFDVVVTDLLMPGMNGLDLLQRAREISPDTRRVLLSGNCGLGSALEGISQTTVDQFILKPWSPVELRETIRRVAHAAR